MTNSRDSLDELEYVSESIIRDAFNKGRFFERAKSGELRHRIMDYNTHLSSRQRRKLGEPKEPRCTRSQMVAYYDQAGKMVAAVHQYKRRDGSLRGLPDPKRLVYGNRRLAVRQASEDSS